ncbi:hypothetical protein [Photobacterium galatheae]|uniref:Uncharacterized protein n=1 Tax=Photobacterium galatheae TaxID=1654360 RepID=A0A066RPL2_9GAMM|nr:hypothetical protein [Photobacterium galatheae]KDM91051.1 hypothetical protein EA58_15020 [Photobacterium galatheae]MCM0148997.1 hypothetical protein [Photobacterium galatheae]
MNSAQTKSKLAQDELDALALYKLYSDPNSSNEELFTELKKLKDKRRFRPIWSTMCALQHNPEATIRIENDIHTQIGTKDIRMSGKSYTVTVYFLPVSLSTSPDLEDVETLNGLQIRASLPQNTCNELAEAIKRYIQPNEGEQISILSGLIDRSLLTSFQGLEFVNGLTKRLADYVKDQTKDEAIIKWLAKFDAMEPIKLTPRDPEDHRALVIYTLTEVENRTVNERLTRQNCLVKNYMGEKVNTSDYALGKELHQVITSTYSKAISQSNTNFSIVSSTLPPQTFAFLRLSYFSNTLIDMISLTRLLWGRVGLCATTNIHVSEYLSKIGVTIQTGVNSGEFAMTQIYEPSYRYNPASELSCHIDMVKNIAGVDIHFNKV